MIILMPPYLPDAKFISGKSNETRLIIFLVCSILLHLIIIFLIHFPKDVLSNKKRIIIPVKIPHPKPEQIIKPDNNLIQNNNLSEENTAQSQQNKYSATKKAKKKVLNNNPPPAIKSIPPERLIENNQPDTIKQQPIKPVSELLKSVTDMMQEPRELVNDFEVFNPALDKQLRQAHHDQAIQNQFKKNELNVEDDSLSINGYRTVIKNGQCWQIPDDTSFDENNFQLAVRDPSCDTSQKGLLAPLINKLK